MAIQFRCPECNRLLRTPDEHAGQQGRCPHCHALTQVPFKSQHQPKVVEAPVRMTASGLRPNKHGLVLGLGIAGLCCAVPGICCMQLGTIGMGLCIGAIVCANSESRAIQQERADPEGKEKITIGFWLGVLGLVLAGSYFLITIGLYAAQVLQYF